MRFWVITTLLMVVFLVIVLGSEDLSVQETQAAVQDRTSHDTILEESLKPHRRSKRTIGHIFDMFKKMMDGLFGGGKKGGGKGKGAARR